MADERARTAQQRRLPIRAEIAGNRLQLLEGGEERMEALLALIGEATASLRLLFYMFNSDAAGARVRDALVAAAARGVKVQLLLDGFGCADADPEFFGALRSEGGEFCLFHPSYGRRYLLRNHQKLVIADDRAAILGGANIHDAYLSDTGPGHWRDLWLRVEGDAVPAAGAYFDSIYRWTTTKGAKLRQLRRLVSRHSQSRGPLQWKFTSPLSRHNPWPSSLIKDLMNARKVDILAAYFSPPRSMLRRLIKVAGLGKVRVITASKSDNLATVGAARHTYQRLLRRGVEIYEYEPARLHTKLLVVDDVVHVGSANFDFRSIHINLEIMLRVEDAGFAERMRGYFEGEREDSRQITAALHRRRASAWRRFKWMVSHWLVTSMDYTVTRRLNFRKD